MEPIAPARRLLTDRQADESMQVFTRLTDDFTIEGYQVCSAMRYTFFVDCLQTSHYLGYSRRQLRYWLMSAACEYQAERAEVLFVQEGLSQRERDQNEPLMDWLRLENVTAGFIYAPRRSRLRRLSVSVGTAVSWRSLFAGMERYFTATDSLGRQLMKEFDLDAQFLDWFRSHVALALASIKKARLLLEKISPRPKAILFSSEHHPNSRPVLLAARALGISTVLVQHGFLGQEWLHWPILSDKLCVWGEVDRQWYIRRGVKAELEVTGSHRAFEVTQYAREQHRTKYCVSEGQVAVIFFAPNLSRDYHAKAAAFIREARNRVGTRARWFVRMHPSSDKTCVNEYDGFSVLSTETPMKEACAFADLVLHDYSTMAFSQFAGIETACLPLDPPYPQYYHELLGGQRVINSIDELCNFIRAVGPGYQAMARPTPAMAAGGQEALRRVGQSILGLVERQVL
jgi:hypothetical protein